VNGLWLRAAGAGRQGAPAAYRALHLRFLQRGHMIRRTAWLFFLSPILAAAAEPDPKTLNDLVVKLMQETKVVAVMSISVPASEYRADGDPNTLEIVFLTKKSDGPSRVSDDGEVIFLYHASDKEQSDLIAKAFDIRARRRLAGT
jgi:hypothetical protein